MKKKLFIALAIGIVFVGIQAFVLWRIGSLSSKLDKKIEDAQWNMEVQRMLQQDTILPDVGSIQFLKRGYSIEIENVKYTAEGLYLKGFIGDPLVLWISNLTLEFSATKNIYEYRDEFQKSDFFWPQPIGKAQTSIIASLGPRGRAPFEVTIPNIKQTKEGVRIEVSFKGERYNY